MSEPVYHVLVVEDDPHLAAGVAENLRAKGYGVDTVADGRKARLVVLFFKVGP